MTFFLKPFNLNSDEVTSDELTRSINLITRQVNPLTGFELHLLRCVEKKALPACPKERAILLKSLEWIQKQRPAKDLGSILYEDDDDYDYVLGVDEFLASSVSSRDFGFSAIVDIETRSGIERVLDHKAYDDWAHDQHQR